MYSIVAGMGYRVGFLFVCFFKTLFIYLDIDSEKENTAGEEGEGDADSPKSREPYA